MKQFFDARVEPQFLILINGSELRRIIGYNFLKISEYCNQATNLHYTDYQYVGDSGQTWERFYDAFDRFSQIGEYDRDAMKVWHES